MMFVIKNNIGKMLKDENYRLILILFLICEQENYRVIFKTHIHKRNVQCVLQSEDLYWLLFSLKVICAVQLIHFYDIFHFIVIEVRIIDGGKKNHFCIIVQRQHQIPRQHYSFSFCLRYLDSMRKNHCSILLLQLRRNPFCSANLVRLQVQLHLSYFLFLSSH